DAYLTPGLYELRKSFFARRGVFFVGVDEDGKIETQGFSIFRFAALEVSPRPFFDEKVMSVWNVGRGDHAKIGQSPTTSLLKSGTEERRRKMVEQRLAQLV